MFRSGLGSTAVDSYALGILAGGYYLRGWMTVPKALERKLDLGRFGRFIALTRALIKLPDGSQRTEAYILVNREQVSLFGEVDGLEAAEEPRVAAEENDLARLIRELG